MDALIVVDVQNDFLPTGALPVPEGDAVIAVANRAMQCFPHVVATQDWHPADHVSFAANHPGRRPLDAIELPGAVPGQRQTLWPMHCVERTLGADFAPGLDCGRIRHIVRKGTDRQVDSYSGFFDNDRRQSTGLAEHLRSVGVDRVFVLGLATDYCVRATALDACRLGFDTTVLTDGCRGVGPRDAIDAVWDELRSAGVRLTTLAALECAGTRSEGK